MAAPVAQTGAGNVATASTNSGTSLVFTKPSNIADGDLLVCMVYFRNGGSAGSAPAGWYSSARSELTLATHMVWFKNITSAAGEAATYTFTTPNGSNRAAGVMFRVTGAKASTSEHSVGTVQTTADPGSLSGTAPALTTTMNDCLVVGTFVAGNATTTPSSITPPTGMTEVGEATAQPGSSSDVEACAVALATAGSSGAKQATWTPASTSMSAFLVAIEPSVQTISPSGIATGYASGTAVITQSRVILPTGIPPLDEMLDTMELGFGPWGIPTITLSNPLQTVAPSGIASAEAFGTPTITTGAPTIVPQGIISSEDFGFPTITITAPEGLIVGAGGIASGEQFGTPTVFRPGSTGPSLTLTIVGDYWQSPSPGDRPYRARLWYRIPIAVSLLKVNGQWIERMEPSEELVAQSDYYFPGGRIHPINDALAVELIAAGYGPYVDFGSPV